ncbi:MAG: hypothetical protein V4642_11810 [Bacteroidota bacterium]
MHAHALRHILLKALAFGVISCLFVHCANRAENCIYLIPKGFTGNVVIVFGQKNGEQIEYKNEKRLYRIPENGVLKTKFQKKYGIANMYFLRESSLKENDTIKYMNPADWNNIKLDSSKIAVWNLQSGNKLIGKEKVHFELLTIGQIKKSDSISNLRSNFMWSILDSL